MILCHNKPYKKLTSQTLGHWIKDTFNKGGINTSIFTAYNMRHAATSTANKPGVNIDVIRKIVGWSRSCNHLIKKLSMIILLVR